MLSERGLECKGCADKDDYVQMSFSNQHLPILPPPVIPEPVPETSEKSKKEADDVSILPLYICWRKLYFFRGCTSKFWSSYLLAFLWRLWKAWKREGSEVRKCSRRKTWKTCLQMRWLRRFVSFHIFWQRFSVRKANREYLYFNMSAPRTTGKSKWS